LSRPTNPPPPRSQYENGISRDTTQRYVNTLQRQLDDAHDEINRLRTALKVTLERLAYLRLKIIGDK
jgi:hypothetical protein